MKSNQHHSLHHQAGFSLVEILVGLVIGLIATLVIMQVFSVFEGQKRTTSGSSDAQTNGSIALYNITKELEMAGFGLPPIPSPTLQKTISAFACTTPTWGAGVTDMSPVTITDGGTGPGASDSIKIRYGKSPMGAIPSLITNVGVDAAGKPNVTLDNNMTCTVGDVAMIVNANGSACNFTDVIGPGDLKIPPVPSTPNPDLTTVTVTDNTGAIGYKSTLTCLGKWQETTFRVNPSYDPNVAANSQAYLEKSGDSTGVANSVADIVNIQAQYGVSDTITDNQVTHWYDATAIGGTNWAAPSVADRNRIKAIHIAVVARNGLYEKGIVTTPCTTNKGTVNKGPCAWDDTNVDAAPKIDLSNDKLPGDPTNDQHWQHYRYRVFEAIIPLRNMVWAKSSL